MVPSWCYLTVLISVLTIACFTFTDLSNLFLFAYWQTICLPHVIVCYKKKLYSHPSVHFQTTEKEHFCYILGLNILAYLYSVGGYLGEHGGAVVGTVTSRQEGSVKPGNQPTTFVVCLYEFACSSHVCVGSGMRVLVGGVYFVSLVEKIPRLFEFSLSKIWFLCRKECITSQYIVITP